MFVLHPDYKLRLEAMVLQVDFKSVSVDMKDTLQAYISAIDLTISSITLEQFLRLVLRIGNFLNKVR